MALERVPADIRARRGRRPDVADPEMIQEIQSAVTIPVMAKCRIGHLVEARILEALEVDFIDESEVLTPADEENHVYKHDFRVPFVCGCRDLGEALRRIGEGAAMIRTKGRGGDGQRRRGRQASARDAPRDAPPHAACRRTSCMAEAKQLQAPYELVVGVAETGKLPVPNFAAGGIATPADAAL